MDRVFPTDADLLSALPEELDRMAEAAGLPRFRGQQIFSWIHKRGICDPSLMTDLPKSLRGRLDQIGPTWPARIGEVHRAGDATRKIQVVLEDGCAVETVLIPDGDKLTQCISCQVGCAVRCAFCRSGSQGFKRNLKASEILSQIYLAMPEHLPTERLTNVVLMGVGEPLHNFDASIRAVELLAHPQGLDLSSRRITLSTVGLVKGIDRLARATGGKVALAVSLHAANDSTRRRLVPGAKDSLADLVAALKRYPLPKRRRFTIEYVLIKGINDSVSDARDLVRLLSHLRVKVNLLPLNPHDRTDLEPPDEDRVLAFQEALIQKGVSVYLRRRRGDDISAACGQLLALQ